MQRRRVYLGRLAAAAEAGLHDAPPRNRWLHISRTARSHGLRRASRQPLSRPL